MSGIKMKGKLGLSSVKHLGQTQYGSEENLQTYPMHSLPLVAIVQVGEVTRTFQS
jgi:hypothetical protein